MTSSFKSFDADVQDTSGQAGEKSASESQGMMDQTKAALSGAQETAANIGGQAASKVDAGLEKAVGGMDTLASTLHERADSMGDGKVQNVAVVAADKLASGAELLRGKDTDQLVADLEAFVRSKPVESLLIAFGVGFFLSKSL